MHNTILTDIPYKHLHTRGITINNADSVTRSVKRESPCEIKNTMKRQNKMKQDKIKFNFH